MRTHTHIHAYARTHTHTYTHTQRQCLTFISPSTPQQRIILTMPSPLPSRSSSQNPGILYDMNYRQIQSHRRRHWRCQNNFFDRWQLLFRPTTVFFFSTSVSVKNNNKLLIKTKTTEETVDWRSLFYFYSMFAGTSIWRKAWPLDCGRGAFNPQTEGTGLGDPDWRTDREALAGLGQI